MPTNLAPIPPRKPQQANQTATKDPILDGIIDRKTASVTTEKEPQTAAAPVINVTVDTTAIASEIEKVLTAQASQNAEITGFKASIDTIITRLDSIDNTPQIVDSPDGLDENPKPTIYIASNTRAMDAKAAFKEFEHLFDNVPKVEMPTRDDGVIVARDPRLIDRFVAQNRQVLQQAMHDEGYKNGMFRAAATSINDIPAAFSGYLASVMRLTPNWGGVWWQFLNPVIRLGVGFGNKVDVPRAGKINRPTASSDWKLTGTAFSSASQPLTNGYERVEIARYGMGEPGKNNDPVGLPEFMRVLSMMDMEEQVRIVLGTNYNEFQEIKTWEEYNNTPTTFYFKGSNNSIQLAPTGFTPADFTPLSFQYLLRARTEMNVGIGVIPWEDGCYALVAHPRAIDDLELELRSMAYPATTMELEKVTNMVKVVNTTLNDKISGYRFTVGGFHIFAHENIPNDPLYMQSSTTAPVANWYDNIAFGPMAVADVISMPAEIRRDEIRNFGTQDRYIWLSYKEIQAIERGSASTGAGIGQRTQIVKLRSRRV